mmetsp:Transcript_1859/g.1654  ORF Transcript_1859/g.1654 Transcript_1859/m.1654 type:complete len:105 (-) Transcript_1859:347-661(-)
MKTLLDSGNYGPKSHLIVYSASIFLATKVQETPFRVRDIINSVFFAMNQFNENTIELDLSNNDIEGNDPLYTFMGDVDLAEYTEKKELVFKVEQHLLRLFNFEF